jgi:outer membrane protein assembly factor BamB/tetratricopeptide (TPR) repeat protein
MMPVFGGPEELTGSTNRLAAYDLATEGKLAWELDGNSRTGAFAGAFFLGPPLAVDDSIFAIAEVRGALYLLALDPRTGRFQWRQQLANLEQSVALDPLRRLVGTSPSYAAGILVCPTTSGVIVAVDVVKRQFAWVYRYPFHQQTAADLQNAWQHRVQQQQTEQNDRWLDGDVVLADGKVFVTPPESTELHCLDLRTGKLLWKHVRDDSLTIGCVEAGNVLLVGSESLRVLRGEDGAPVTPNDRLALPSGALPAGHGYLSEGRFYLPLTTGQIVVVDVGRGEIVETLQANAGTELGNLISHRGTVISQSALLLDKFEQIDLLRQRVADALMRNPDDAGALRELAEMRRVDGDLSEAVRLLKRAYQLTPNDPLVREMLAETLLDVLATDYSTHQDNLSLLSKLISGHAQQVALLRLEAAGLQSLGRREQAFEAYLKMADLAEPEGSSIRISAQHSARIDRWVRSHLNTLWSEASAGERQSITNALAARRQSWGNHPTAIQLRHYLAHFDGLPGTNDVRIRLAQILVDNKNVQESEIELLRLENSSAHESQAAAAVLMAKLLLSMDRRDEADPYVAALAGRWGDVVALDGKTGQQWLSELGLDSDAVHDASVDRWPRGRVDTEVIPTSVPQNAAARRAQAETQGFVRRLRVEQVYPTELASPQWFLADNFRRLVGRNKWGEDIFRIDFRRGRQSRNAQIKTNLVQAAHLGHLIYLSVGNEIVAVDSRQIGDEVLWRVFPAGSGAQTPTRNRGRRNPTIYHASSDRQRAFGPEGLLFGSLGPVTPEGVVFQEQDQLKCVDPITGDTLWSRSDVPAGCELFGDEQMVFAADIERGTAQVFSAIDGTLLGERQLPDFPWMLTAGRNVAQIVVDFQNGPKKTLRIVDVWSGETLFESDYHASARFAVVEPHLLVVVRPGREIEFQCIDARTGNVLIDQPIHQVDFNKPGKIHALVSQDDLFLLIDTEALQQNRPIGTDYPVVTGQVYAFDLQSGEPLWPGPAYVRHRGIALIQPSSIPLLVFVDREEKRDATAGSSAHLRLLCLDKQTGQTVFRDDELPDTAGGHFRIFAERGEQPTISIEMSTRTARLMLTDEPRPPGPPANDDVEAARRSLGRGLWEVGRRMGDVLQEALQNPGGTIWPVPASKPMPQRAPGIQHADEQQIHDD